MKKNDKLAEAINGITPQTPYPNVHQENASIPESKDASIPDVHRDIQDASIPENMQSSDIEKSAIKIQEEYNDKLKNFTCRLPISLLKDVYAIEFNYKMLTNTNLTHDALV